jgi:flagellar FliL protein
MADTDGKEVKEKSSGGLLPIINLALLVLVLAVGGFIAWKLVSMEQPAAPVVDAALAEQTALPEAEDDTNAPPVIMEIDDITVNLADTDRDRFLRATIKLELRNEDAKAKVTAYADPVRDLIGKILRAKKFSDIRSPQGTSALQEELIIRLNRRVGGKPIKNVYFTDFVSQ